MSRGASEPVPLRCWSPIKTASGELPARGGGSGLLRGTMTRSQSSPRSIPRLSNTQVRQSDGELTNLVYSNGLQRFAGSGQGRHASRAFLFFSLHKTLSFLLLAIHPTNNESARRGQESCDCEGVLGQPYAVGN